MTADEPLIEENIPRLGVILCECGGEISNSIDLEALAGEAAKLPGVVYVHHEAYPCSKDGQERLRSAVREQHLERVLVAGCAPRLVDRLFISAAQPVGIEPGCLMVTNIRELSVLNHPGDPQAAGLAVFGAVETGAARLATTQPNPPHTGKVRKSALVIGSGLSGLSVALTLAGREIPVTLIEPEEELSLALPDMDERTRQLTLERKQTALNTP